MKGVNLRKYIIFLVIGLFLGVNVIPIFSSNELTFNIKPLSNTLYVGGTGPGNYSEIQDAIDDANPGDTVFVYTNSNPWPYYQNIIINKSITLKGQDKKTTKLYGKYNTDDVIKIIKDNVTVERFTIGRSKWGPDYAGIKIESDNNRIIDNNIIDNQGNGIFLINSNHNIIEKNYFFDNSIPGRGEINFYNSCYNIVKYNIVDEGSFNILLDHESNYNKIISNNISNAYYSGINVIYDCSYNEIVNNNIFNNQYEGIEFWIRCNNNVIKSNNLSDNGDEGINIYYSFYNNINHNHIIGNDEGIKIDTADNNIISKNDIISNEKGVIFVDGANYNSIFNNNLIKNNLNTYFFGYKNKWDGNYYNEKKYLPVLIHGHVLLGNTQIPWINIDWHPAKEPYDI